MIKSIADLDGYDGPAQIVSLFAAGTATIMGKRLYGEGLFSPLRY